VTGARGDEQAHREAGGNEQAEGDQVARAAQVAGASRKPELRAQQRREQRRDDSQANATEPGDHHHRGIEGQEGQAAAPVRLERAVQHRRQRDGDHRQRVPEHRAEWSGHE
jgi:hypothetical protein